MGGFVCPRQIKFVGFSTVCSTVVDCGVFYLDLMKCGSYMNALISVNTCCLLYSSHARIRTRFTTTLAKQTNNELLSHLQYDLCYAIPPKGSIDI